MFCPPPPRRRVLRIQPCGDSGWFLSTTSAHPWLPYRAKRPTKGVASIALMSAFAPLSNCTKGPSRRFPARQAPVVGRQREEFVLTEVRLDLEHRPQLARIGQPPQLQHGRLEAPLVTDRQRHARTLDRLERSQHLGARQAQRLLAEHVL